jgi:hypothetical protein
MNPLALTVYECPFPKLRLGKHHDGGYVIADIPGVEYQLLLAGGIERDISFEEDFVKKYKSRCVAFDGTIPKLPKEHETIEFVRKNIGYANTNTETNLHDLIDSNEKIFVKMDIEGGEIPWMKSLSIEQICKFDQIVMEFHTPFSDKEVEVFEKINASHVLVHFHPNNCCGTRFHRGVEIPNIFECTYLNKRFLTAPLKLNKTLIPGGIDMKNTPKPDIFISHAPFVHR